MKNKFVNAIYLTFENAKNLHEEAEILMQHKKSTRAYSLYHLCFEECGRFKLLHNFFLEYIQGNVKLKDFNYGNLKKLGYENHEIKISKSFLQLYTLSFINIEQNQDKTREEIEKLQAQLLDELTVWQNQEAELNRLKNVSLYVTFYDNDFHLPDLAITLKQFVEIRKLAKLGLHAVKNVIDYIEAKGGFENLKEVYESELKFK